MIIAALEFYDGKLDDSSLEIELEKNKNIQQSSEGKKVEFREEQIRALR